MPHWNRVGWCLKQYLQNNVRYDISTTNENRMGLHTPSRFVDKKQETETQEEIWRGKNEEAGGQHHNIYLVQKWYQPSAWAQLCTWLKRSANPLTRLCSPVKRSHLQLDRARAQLLVGVARPWTVFCDICTDCGWTTRVGLHLLTRFCHSISRFSLALRNDGCPSPHTCPHRRGRSVVT